MQYYLVGGALRDILLGKEPREYDIAFDGPVAAFLQASASVCKVGQTTPVYISHGYEHVPLRGGSVEHDLTLRDFTINAFAMGDDGILRAHPLALQDLQQGCIRPASPATFSDDPARIYRAARFSAVFPDFFLHESMFEQINTVLAEKRQCTISAERVGKELEKAMYAPKPGNFLRTMYTTGSLSPWFAELEDAGSRPAGPEHWHGKDTVLDHTAAVMDAAADLYTALGKAGSPEAALAAWMGLCHDLGKTVTPQQYLPRHIGHEHTGTALVQTLADRLRLSTRWKKAGIIASRLHMKGGIFHTLRAGTRVDMLMELHAARILDPFFALVEADSGDSSIAAAAKEQLRIICTISLPEEFQNRGKESGEKLRELRCKALSQHTIC